MMTRKGGNEPGPFSQFGSEFARVRSDAKRTERNNFNADCLSAARAAADRGWRVIESIEQLPLHL